MKAVEIKIPEFGESITEVTIVSWLKNEGDHVEEDAPLAELETDKVSVELTAPQSGVLSKINQSAGAVVQVGDVAAIMIPGKKEAAPISSASAAKQLKEKSAIPKASSSTTVLPPAVEKMVKEKNIDISLINGTGKNNQITKEDVINHLEKTAPTVAPQMPAPQTQLKITSQEESEEIVPMTRLRQVIAKRLVDAQQTAAILTTFNEIDMKALIDLRKKYKEPFTDKYGVKPGFMSMFTAATINALKAFPAINSEIRGTDIIYKNYYHIGIAVGGPKGLVVPALRHADQLSLAEIELEIARLANKVRDGSITVSDLEGSTFTISNGGIYGSMLSTPILNPPQTGILGMHNIVERPVVVNNEIMIRPIMYVALSYDHRMVDGKEAVQFLVKIKETIEDPLRLFLQI